MKYKGYEILKCVMYSVWKDGVHLEDVESVEGGKEYIDDKVID